MPQRSVEESERQLARLRFLISDLSTQEQRLQLELVTKNKLLVKIIDANCDTHCVIEQEQRKNSEDSDSGGIFSSMNEVAIKIY